MVRVEGYGHAPGKGGSAHPDVLQSRTDEGGDPVLRAIRGNGRRIRLDVIEQPVSIFGKSEEVGLFGQPLHLAPRVHGAGAVRAEVVLRVEGLARRAVPTLVRPQGDVAPVVEPLEDRRGHLLVPRLARPDEVIVGKVAKTPRG